jgi:hypothetical protein
MCVVRIGGDVDEPQWHLGYGTELGVVGTVGLSAAWEWNGFGRMVGWMFSGIARHDLCNVLPPDEENVECCSCYL